MTNSNEISSYSSQVQAKVADEGLLKAAINQIKSEVSVYYNLSNEMGGKIHQISKFPPTDESQNKSVPNPPSDAMDELFEIRDRLASINETTRQQLSHFGKTV